MFTYKKNTIYKQFYYSFYVTLKRYAGVIDNKKIECSAFTINIIDEQFFTIYVHASPSPTHHA
jgi:hypothetical protein